MDSQGVSISFHIRLLSLVTRERRPIVVEDLEIESYNNDLAYIPHIHSDTCDTDISKEGRWKWHFFFMQHPIFIIIPST